MQLKKLSQSDNSRLRSLRTLFDTPTLDQHDEETLYKENYVENSNVTLENVDIETRRRKEDGHRK